MYRCSIKMEGQESERQPRPQGLPRGGARAEEDPGKIQ
jgi:hypothetical protein